MEKPEKREGMLSPCRVLDLTDEKGLLCGKLLGDLGADVIKIERPGGDPARRLGPFYHDEVDPEKSLFWMAFNTSKRGMTLDIETAAGQEVFKRLVETADFVIESFPPAYLDGLGLGYSALEKVNPGIIMVSITPFGQTGPYKDYKAPDIVAWAMGGMMYLWGEADRPPVRASYPQAYLHAALQASVGALIALHHRLKTGEGQHIDLSIQEAVVWSTYKTLLFWDMVKVIQRRGELIIHRRMVWPCQDGNILCFYHGGYQANHHNLPLVQWMDEEGMATDFLKRIDWETVDFSKISPQVSHDIEEPTGKFFLAHTKAELLEGAVKRNIQLYPVATAKDIWESAQLAAREYWVEFAHPELNTNITYPGAFAKASETPLRVSRRAPLVGEHNREIYEKELSGVGLLASRQAQGYPAGLKKKSGTKPALKPLDGMRVVDFTWQVGGPIVSKTLADHGAQVIKIEGKKRHDQLRLDPPFKDGVVGLERSGMYLYYNTGKLDVTLNLDHPKGVEIAKGFIARADIVLDNFAGGKMERMGLGYEQLRKVKPDIIMLSACMQGQTGPHARHPGLGFHLSALSGFSHIAGWPDRQPLNLGPYTDYIVPHFCELVILAALDYRRRTGRGQYIDVSQYEASVHFMAPLILDYVLNHRIASRMGNRADGAAPHGAYRCRGDDRWCVIAVFTDEEWQSFSKVIGNPAWTRSPKFRTLRTRKENEDELDQLVGEWTVNHSAEEVMSLMQAAGVAAGVVASGEDLLEHDPQLKHRRFFQEVDHPQAGKHHQRRPAFLLSKSPVELRRAPLLGEHNEYALKEILGLSAEEIAGLVIEGVIE